MKIVQAILRKNQEWEYLKPKVKLKKPLVIVFGNRILLENKNFIQEIRNEFPYEDIVFGTSSGEIIDSLVINSSAVVTAIEFEKSKFVVKTANIFDFDNDAERLGKYLYEKIPKEGLKHMFLLSDGSFTNACLLINGIEKEKNDKILLTGGICSDDILFEKTLASYKEDPKSGEIVLLGLYGETLDISVACHGGWIPFGPERLITKSNANVIYEIDDVPALDLYKKYLGDNPQSSLYFPLNVKEQNKNYAIVRTILSTNEEEKSMTLTGEVKFNSRVQLMMTSVDSLTEGAYKAANYALNNRKKNPELALIVSCLGRKLIMNQRIEEEIEEVKSIIGDQVVITGFYSYGEIAPFEDNTVGELHNQTITLTLLSE